MNETPIDLIRKLDETATALLELVAAGAGSRRGGDRPGLREEMMESAEGWERSSGRDG